MIHSFFPVRKKVGSNTAVVSKLLCLNVYQIAERKAKHIENGEMIYHKFLHKICTEQFTLMKKNPDISCKTTLLQRVTLE